MKIIELTQHESTRLQQDLVRMTADGALWRTVKVSVDGAGFKYKCGEGMWSPSLGHDLAGTTRAVDPDPMVKLKALVAEIELAENEADQHGSDLGADASTPAEWAKYDEFAADANGKSAERLGVLLRAIHDLIDD
jgi:hypothetical protein